MAKKKAKAKKKKYNPIAYVKAANPGDYVSAYTNQINSSINDMSAAKNEMAAERQRIRDFKYDPMSDANYQAMAQIYGARGNQAAQDTLGDAASLNGGYGTSFAVSAAQQARNQYNQELAALVPDFEANAYNRMVTNYGLLQDNYGVLQDDFNMWKGLDTDAYDRYRDRVADYQWGKGYDTDIYQYNVQQAAAGAKSGGGGGGGRRRGSGGGGGGYSGGGGSTITDDYLRNVYEKTAAKVNGSGASGNPNSVMAYKSSGGAVKNQSVSEALARTKSKKKKI